MGTEEVWLVAAGVACGILLIANILSHFINTGYRAVLVLFILVVVLAGTAVVIGRVLPGLERGGTVDASGGAAIWIGAVSFALFVVCWAIYEFAKMVRRGGLFDD